jgi:hypothetical protein
LRQSHKTILIWVILILMFVSIYSMFTDSSTKEKELDVTTFKAELQNKAKSGRSRSNPGAATTLATS